MSEILDHPVTKGDTRTPIASYLKQKDADGEYAAVNLAGGAVVFRMVNQAGTAKVDDAAATIVDAATGSVSYSWTDADVDTAGVFWAWFIVTISGKTDTFPGPKPKALKSRKFRVTVSEAG